MSRILKFYSFFIVINLYNGHFSTLAIIIKLNNDSSKDSDSKRLPAKADRFVYLHFGHLFISARKRKYGLKFLLSQK